jgi:hypothetical protein
MATAPKKEGFLGIPAVGWIALIIVLGGFMSAIAKDIILLTQALKIASGVIAGGVLLFILKKLTDPKKPPPAAAPAATPAAAATPHP